MSIMAKYARIFWADPKDSDVGARNRSVAVIAKSFSSIEPQEAIEVASQLAGGLAGGELKATLLRSIESAISDESEAFQILGNEQQGVVCGAVAALDLIRTAPIRDGGWSAADALAAALWSALGLQDPSEHPQIETLRTDLLVASRDRVLHVANETRKRHEVPDVGNLKISETDPTGTRSQAAYKRATAPVIDALKQNAELDREELDFLWWALSGHSSALNCPLSDKDPLCRAVAAGVHAASMLRRLPTDGHRHVAMRLVGKGENASLKNLIAALGADRASFASALQNSIITRFPSVFPLLSAIVEEDAHSKTAVELDPRSWGARALLESAIVELERRRTT